MDFEMVGLHHVTCRRLAPLSVIDQTWLRSAGDIQTSVVRRDTRSTDSLQSSMHVSLHVYGLCTSSPAFSLAKGR